MQWAKEISGRLYEQTSILCILGFIILYKSCEIKFDCAHAISIYILHLTRLNFTQSIKRIKPGGMEHQEQISDTSICLIQQRAGERTHKQHIHTICVANLLQSAVVHPDISSGVRAGGGRRSCMYLQITATAPL